MINKEKNKKEAHMLVLCNEVLNGYSKAFRDAWASKNQDERITFMEMILEDAMLEGKLDSNSNYLKGGVN